MIPRRRRPTGRATVIVAATALAALAAGGCAAGGLPSAATGDSNRSGTASADFPRSGTEQHEEPMRIRPTTGSKQATATLEDNAAARDLASMLPLTVAMSDLFGREKPGLLPRALSGDAEPVFTYRVGQIAYWPPDHNIFVVYDGDGLTVPSPGLVPLGTVDAGLDVIATAGDDFDLTITALD